MEKILIKNSIFQYIKPCECVIKQVIKFINAITIYYKAQESDLYFKGLLRIMPEHRSRRLILKSTMFCVSLITEILFGRNITF